MSVSRSYYRKKDAITGLITIAKIGNQFLKKSKEKPLLASSPIVLVDGKGKDFRLCDRSQSLKELGDMIDQKVISFYQANNQAQYLYPIPVLGNATGVGKSRFLQELTGSFRAYFQTHPYYSSEAKDMLESAVYINVSFDNEEKRKERRDRFKPTMHHKRYPTPQSHYEHHQHNNIVNMLCLKILHQFCEENQTFADFYSTYSDINLSLDFIKTHLLQGFNGFVLGIDGLEWISKEHVRELAKEVGYYNSSKDGSFFVPILSGVNVKDMQDGIYLYQQIPLPLLSLESCVDLLIQKRVLFNKEMECFVCRNVLYDIGGHVQLLEILLDHVQTINDKESTSSRWQWVRRCLLNDLQIYYCWETPLSLTKAIAYSMLPIEPQKSEPIDDQLKLTFFDLNQMGLIEFTEQNYIEAPFFASFASFSQIRFMDLKSEEEKYLLWFFSDWRIITEYIQGAIEYYQGWEEFSIRYICFRLQLFSYLKYQTISLAELFKGASMNVDDINIIVPFTHEIFWKPIKKQFPMDREQVNDYLGVRNYKGAPCDGYMFTKTVDGKPLVLMSYAKSGYHYRFITDDIIHKAYQECKQSMEQYLPGTDFCFVFYSVRRGSFDVNKLPKNCVVICRQEMPEFFRMYYQKIMAKVWELTERGL